MAKLGKDIGKIVAVILGAPLFVLIVFYIFAQSLTNSILSTPDRNLDLETQNFIFSLGIGIAVFIFFGLLFAIAIKRNIHG